MKRGLVTRVIGYDPRDDMTDEEMEIFVALYEMALAEAGYPAKLEEYLDGSGRRNWRADDAPLEVRERAAGLVAMHLRLDARDLDDRARDAADDWRLGWAG